MDKRILQKYAELIVSSGLNLQPGQEVLIRCEPEQPDFVVMVVEECYKAGASKVEVEWSYAPITKLHIIHQSEEALSTIEDYEELKLKHRSEVLPASLYLDSDDPDGLDGIDIAKWSRAQQARYKITKPYKDKMENKHQWCIAAVPGKAWARKVFPGLSDSEAEEKLWEAILSCSHALGEDPVGEWKKHNETIMERCEWLNSLRLRRLNYRCESTGTDFTVGLLPQAKFMGGADCLVEKNLWFDCNIPTEEVFVTPRAGDCEGIVYSTRPFSYRGTLIDKFSIRFENGRAVEVHAEEGEEALKAMISMDEGSAMLGECALVPHKSPISQSGILFYSTLFDENAACHLALGAGYSSCVEGFEKMTIQELHELGVNDSMIHEDFMIGCAELDIDGVTESGEIVPIFRGGEWAD